MFSGILMGLYVAGSNFFECGKSSSRITISYLSDAATIELCVAVFACIFAFVAAYSLVLFGHKARVEYPLEGHESIETSAYFKVGLVWSPILLLMSVFPALYAISTNVPGENTLGIGKAVLDLIQHSSGGIMYGINAVLTPLLVVKTFHNPNSTFSSYHTTRVIMFSRTWLMLVVPTVVTIWVNQDCQQGWLKLWSTCESRENFNIEVHLHSQGLASQPDKILVDGWSPAYVGKPGSSISDTHIPITQHNDICAAGSSTSGRCSRAVVGTLGHLVVSKLFFAAFMSPFLMVLIQTDLIRYLKRGCKNVLTCKAWSAPREDTIDLSVEVAGVTMLLEYCLVLGFVVPLILPLTGITFLLHLAVFHRSVENGFTLQMDSTPSSLYLFVSFLIGCALVIWFFWENALHGKELVAAGVPTMAFAAWSLQMVMPVSKAPWSWLVYGPRSSLSYFTDPAVHEKQASVEVELPSAQGPVAPPTMGDAVASTGAFVVRL